MYSVNQPGDSKNFDEKTVDEIVKKIFNPLSNIYTLCATYSKDVSRIDPYTSLHVLDQWVLTRLNMMMSDGTGYLEQFKVFEPVRLLRDFVQDFTTWYIRRSRERFKSKDVQEVSVVVSVTEHVLIEVAKYMAPMAPFYADWLYREVTKGGRMESVHLEQWPQYSDGVSQKEIISHMETVRALVTEALELRQRAGIKVRQPLASLSVSSELPAEFLDIIRDEINVKEVRVVSGNTHLDTTLTPELRNEGVVRDIIRAIQDARKQENLEPSTSIELVVCAGEEIQKLIDEYVTVISEPTSVTRISYTQDDQKYDVGLDGEKVSVSIRY
jgi:isoleucyl-tRNA synthetase